MALQKQLATIVCKGLDTNADPRVSAPGTFDLLENLYFKRTTTEGAELRKRFGVTAKTASILGGGSLGSSARKLSTFNDEQLQINGTQLYSFASQAGAWNSQGVVSPLGLTAEVVGTSGVFLDSQASSPDMAIGGGYACFVWVSPDGAGAVIHATMIDLSTGDRLAQDMIVQFGGVPAGSTVRVIALATKFAIIFWSATIGGTVFMASISYATPTTVLGAVNVVTDLNTTNPRFDVIKNAGLDGLAAVYNKTVAGMKGVVTNNIGTVTGSFTDADIPDKAVGGLTWDGSDNNNYFVYVGAAATTKTVVMTNAGAIGAKTVLDTQAACRNATGYRLGTTNTVYVEVAAANTYDTLIRRSLSTGGGTGVVWHRSCGLGSRPFQVGTAWYVGLAYQSPKQSCYFVVDDTSSARPAPVARALYGLGGGLTTQLSALPSAAMQSSTVVQMPALALSPQAKASSSGTYAPARLTLDFSGAGMSSPRRLGENLHLPGGAVKVYDGAGVSDCGFHLFPELPAAPTLSAGTFTGTYQFRWVYVWIDGRGQPFRSAPSDPLTVTMAAQQAAFAIPILRVDGHKTQGGVPGETQTVIIEQYRTLPGETTFFLDNSTLIVNNNGGGAFAVDTLPSVASVSDATLPTMPKLYTTGNVLPHICPPAARLMEVWRNRLYLAGTENPLELWVSNEYVGDGVSFSDALVILFEADGGPITALAEMDDRLIAFKRNAVYTISGLGPTLSGAGLDSLSPSRLTGAVGAVSQTGVIKTPQGVLFKSTRGWHILPNGGGQPVRLKGVEGFESLTLQGASLTEDLEQARIVTAEGTTLVYHYGLPDEQGRGRWSTFTGQVAVDTIFWNGKWAYLASNGVVQEENGVFADNGATITSKARFSWLNLAGLLGRHRLYRSEAVADWRATFTATIRHAVNFDPTIVQSANLAVTTASLVPIGMVNTRGDAVSHQFTFEETSTTEGFRLSALVLELAGKGAAGKLSVGQAFT